MNKDFTLQDFKNLLEDLEIKDRKEKKFLITFYSIEAAEIFKKAV